MFDMLAQPVGAGFRRAASSCALALVLMLAAPGGPSARADAATAWAKDALPGTLLVTLAAPVDTAELAATAGVAAELTPLSAAVLRVRVPNGAEDDAARRLTRHPAVAAVEPDRLRTFDRTPNDPRYGEQWPHRSTDAETAWDVTTGSREVLVAVIDSGLRGDHPDLAGNIVEQVDATAAPRSAPGVGFDNDACGLGHGTQVAGVVGAVGGNRRGVAGVAWRVGIVDIAVASATDRCDAVADSAVIAALEYARTRPGGPVDVVNLSLGAPGSACPAAYQAEIDAARAAGIVVVASAGNGRLSGSAQPAVPASCAGVVAVGATAPDGAVADYSNANRWVDLVAPGGSTAGAASCAAAVGSCVLTTTREGHGAVEGTSYAAPYVAGVAALIRAVRPDLAPAAVEGLLERTARDQGAVGRDEQSGWGSVNAGAAVTAAAAGQHVDEAEPDPVFPVARRHAAILPAPGPAVTRVSAGSAPTRPVPQAVAVSQATFDDRGAAHVVLARADAYPDALAGSTLGLGAGPLLFTPPAQALDARTRSEIVRVLAPGRTVYLLGGPAALPAALERELADIGYPVTRVAGGSRVETAAAAAREVVARRAALGVPDPGMALLVTAQDWPDAVSAGALGATLGIPILLARPAGLDADTADTLASLSASRLYVVGGTAAISDPVAAAARAAAGPEVQLIRLAGASRSATALAVAGELGRLRPGGRAPALAVAVNYDAAVDGYAHVLSASALLGAHTGVFIPLLGQDGNVMEPATERYLRDVGGVGVIVGGPDVVSPAGAARFAQLLAAVVDVTDLD